MEEITTLKQDLGKMLGDTSFSDMVFVCNDGHEIPALRKLVAARSTVLRTMLLTCGMAESTLTRIPLESMTGPIMRICMEFLYTDDVQTSKLEDMSLYELMEVTAAARFFNIPGLERFSINYCADVMDNMDEPLPIEEIFRAYNLGANLYHDKSHKAMAEMLNKLIIRVESALNQNLENYACLSERGCLHLVENLEPSNAPFYLKQYLLLVHAVWWCTSTSAHMSHPSLGKSEAEKLLKSFLPISEAGLFALLLGEHQMEGDGVKHMKLLADNLSKFLDKWSPDLSKIPPMILYKVFEPLQIIPSSSLLAAYSIQVLCRPTLRWDSWCSHDYYRTSWSEISCMPSYGYNTYSASWVGFARCNTCIMACDYMFFEWEIIFSEACSRFCVGFCMAGGRSSSLSGTTLLGYGEATVALTDNGSIYHSGKVIHQMQPVQCCKGTTIGVHVQLHTGLCIFKANGEKLGELIIAKLGSGVYPAISLCRPGVAQVRAVSYGAIPHTFASAQ